MTILPDKIRAALLAQGSQFLEDGQVATRPDVAFGRKR